jgi:hypothetical protein
MWKVIKNAQNAGKEAGRSGAGTPEASYQFYKPSPAIRANGIYLMLFHPSIAADSSAFVKTNDIDLAIQVSERYFNDSGFTEAMEGGELDAQGNVLVAFKPVSKRTGSASQP